MYVVDFKYFEVNLKYIIKAAAPAYYIYFYY